MSGSSVNKFIGLEKAGDFLKRSHPELLISKQKLRQAEATHHHTFFIFSPFEFFN